MKISQIAYSLIILIASVVILTYGKDLFVPFILAFLLWFIIKELRDLLRKIRFVREKLPLWLMSAFSALVVSSILGVVISMLSNNIQQLSIALPQYEGNVGRILISLDNMFGINVAESVKGFYENFDVTEIISSLISSITSIFSDAFMILLYTLFFFLEEATFMKKIRAVYPGSDRFEQVHELIAKVDKSVGQYLVLKTIVSVLTGLLSYITLLIIGVEAPLFWAFIIFLLNYIPTIGSLLGTTFPAIFALLQFGDLVPFVAVLIVVGIIQVVIGNIVEPKIMGDSLNISSLVVILTLSFWGSIWGITGMILSVPITVIMIIVFAEFPQTHFIAIMLSEEGKVEGGKKKKLA
ncbi:MAG: AI-2E family transporter [Bacteroidales bacterium]|nr:AI-2E family transporter [Bacteroidales bacterium]